MSVANAISDYLGLELADVERIVERAPELYRRYSVKKPSGGSRYIYHPAKETKALQAAAINLLEKKALISDCAYGYVRGLKSPLLGNAKAHAVNDYLLKLDFVDFFPSIKPDDFKSQCAGRLFIGNYELDEVDFEFLVNLFFVFNSRADMQWFLGIGAPSSPSVSNWVMYNMDKEISAMADKNGVVYTRYADDLCFSTDYKDVLMSFEGQLRKLIDNTLSPRLLLNDKKRRFASRNTKKRVCGLSITPTGIVKVPREFKRMIRSKLYAYKSRSLETKEVEILSGYLGYIKDCDPEYLINLSLKYGSRIVYSAMKKHII